MRESTVRSAFVTLAMAVSAVAAAVLAGQAIAAARDHSVTAPRVLLDYAAPGADQAAGRLQSSLAPRCYGILLASIRPGAGQTTRAGIEQALPTEARKMFALVDRALRVSLGAGVVSLLDTSLQPIDAGTLLAVVQRGSAALPPTAYMGMSWVDLA